MAVAKVKCSVCGQENVLGSELIRTVSGKSNGKQFKLMLFDCCACKAINSVQADNDKTEELLERVVSMAQHAMTDGKSKELRKQRERFKVANKNLDKERRKLMKWCEHKTFVLDDGTTLTLGEFAR